jgi:hypothetical protein
MGADLEAGTRSYLLMDGHVSCLGLCQGATARLSTVRNVRFALQ